jgi:hypothetical protein
MSMAIIGITSAGLAIAGTAMAVYGQQQAAKGAEYTAEYNAKLATQQAGHETEVSAENARRKTRENAQIIGLQRDAIAASGLAPTGTPLAILGDSVTTLQRDIMDMGYEAAARANQLHSAAAMSLTEGRNTATGLRTQSYATGLQGVASATSGFLKAKG